MPQSVDPYILRELYLEMLENNQTESEEISQQFGNNLRALKQTFAQQGVEYGLSSGVEDLPSDFNFESEMASFMGSSNNLFGKR